VAGTVLVFSAMVMLGVSLVLILRSPFRRPLGEQLYRLIWLGPMGRAFVRASGRSIWRKGSSGTREFRVSAIARAPEPRKTGSPDKGVVAPDRIEALEQRVLELERWRKHAP
jgi:hypothetical protein